MATAFVLVQDVHLGQEVRVGRDAARLGQHLTPLDVLLLGAAQQHADVVTRPPLVEELAEHLDTGDDGLGGVLDADDLDVVAGVDDALLDLAGDDGAAAGDGEHVLDRHEVRLVEVADGLGHVGVDGVHQLDDLLDGTGVAVEGLERAHSYDRHVVAGELVFREQLPHLELDEVEELLVVDGVHLVERDHDRRYAHLAGEQHVLARLGHRAVGGGHDEDGAVDLGRARDHVLDVVGVPGHVDVRVVALVGLVFDMGDGDGDAPGLLLGGLVDGLEGRVGDVGVGLVEDLGDGGGEGGLAVVDVAHRAHVEVGLGPLELLLRHGVSRLRPLLLCLSCVSLVAAVGLEPTTPRL